MVAVAVVEGTGAALGAAGGAVRGVAPAAARWSRTVVLPLTVTTLVPAFGGTGAGFRTPATFALGAFTQLVHEPRHSPPLLQLMVPPGA